MIVSRRLGGRVAPAIHSLVNRLRADSLMRNSFYIMTTTALQAATGYLFWIIAARMYPAADVGLASALVGVMMLAATLANLGIGPMLVQALPTRQKGDEWSLTLNAVIATGIVASLLTGTIAAAILPVLSPKLAVVGHQSGFMIALIVGVPLLTVATLFDAAFTAERAAGNMLTRTATFACMRIPLLIAPILLGFAGALAICSAWIIAAGCSVIAGMLLIPRLGRSYRLVTRGILRQLRSMLRAVAGHQLISLGALLPIYLLPVFVVARLSLAQNAYFYTTWQVGSLFFMVSPAVAVALLAEGSHAPSAIFQKARSSTFLIAALLLVPMLIAVVGGPLILAMFGEMYAKAGYPLLIILVASAIPDAITNVYVAALRVKRNLAAAAWLNLGMAAMTMALAWLLLPSLGIEGAGWAWLIAQSAGTVVVVIHLMVYVASGKASVALLAPPAFAARWRVALRQIGVTGAALVRHARVERILLIVDPCSAGESLRIAPFVRMVRRSAPQAFITLVGNEDALRALERLDVIDRAVRSDLYNYRPYPRLAIRLTQMWTWLRLVAHLGLGYDRAITFYWGGVLQHALAFVVCRGRRTGFSTYPAVLSRRLLTSNLGAFSWKESHPPQHAALLRAAGIEADGAATPAISVTDVDETAVTLLLQEHLVREGAPLIALHPGSDWACQQWLQERWAALADELAARYSATVLFTGAASETEYVRAIQDRMTKPSASLTGQTSLTQMVALLARCALCVCVDSAIFELTQAAGAPAVVLAGPSRPDTGLFGRIQPAIVRRMDDALALRIGACQDGHNANNELGCWNYQCPMSGLREISVTDALQAVDKTMRRAGAQPRAKAEERPAEAAPTPHPMLVELFDAMSRENIRWLVARGEEDLAKPGDDIDLLIDPRDMPRARAILEERRYLSCPTWGRGTHHFYIGYDPATQTWATLDVVTELTYGPYLNVRTYAAAGALARRRLLGLLNVPAQDDAFWMLFLHCMLDKGRFEPHRARRLVELAPAARTDSPLARQVALACPVGWDPTRLIACVAGGAWADLTQLAPALRAGFHRREPLATRARSLANRVAQFLEIPINRLRRPGMSVALLGPDGAGKSYLATEIRNSFVIPVRLVYMGLWKIGPTRPGGDATPDGGPLWLMRRALEIGARLPKAWSRYVLATYHVARGRVVVFDRYVYDALVSANQPGSWLKRAYMWVLGHSCPAPDLVLILDAPGEVMYARKGEDTPEALEAQRQGLLALRSSGPHVQVVDVTREATAVQADVLTRIWSEYATRRGAKWERERSAHSAPTSAGVSGKTSNAAR
jgi:ADP-heptose:LPS heptosyltransferase/O-antigen/teichoic acid export membrane protein